MKNVSEYHVTREKLKKKFADLVHRKARGENVLRELKQIEKEIQDNKAKTLVKK